MREREREGAQNRREKTSLQIDSIWIYSNWMKHDGISGIGTEIGTAAVAAADAAFASVAWFIFRRMLDFSSK